MKKLILTLLAITVCIGSSVAAAELQVTNETKANVTEIVKTEAKKGQVAEPVIDLASAIKKYKEGNFVGCVQDMQDVVKNDPANALAYYYMAISYASIGKKEDAISAYQKVTNLAVNDKTLSDYAKKGEKCIQNPKGCSMTEESSEKIETEMDKFIKYGEHFSDEVNGKLEEIRLKQLQDSINKDADYKSEMPTNDEIAEAVKTLAKVGVNPVSMNGYQTPYAQSMQAMYQNPEYMQLQMLMGGNNNRSNGNDLMNMLPYFMSQGKNGANSNISADMIKNMMMSSMIGDLSTTFNMDNDR